jgi:hypothetical protein
MKVMSLIAAMKDYFGLKPDQTSMDFLKEIKALSDDDKEYFKALLPGVGYQLT